MSTPVRVTGQTMGITVFNTKAATLEWTPQGNIRVTQVEPGEQPVVLLDAPPSALKQVSNYTTNQAMLVFKPHNGSAIRFSLLNSMIAPEPNESADAYARRTSMTGAPPQEWWAQTLAANGAKVVNWGWGRSLAIAGAIVVGVILVSVVIAAVSGGFR